MIWYAKLSINGMWKGRWNRPDSRKITSKSRDPLIKKSGFQQKSKLLLNLRKKAQLETEFYKADSF